MNNEIKFLDRRTTHISGEINAGSNVVVESNVIFEGKITIGNNVRIRANSTIINSVIESESEIKHYSLIKNSIISQNSIIGPYARLRTGTEIGNNTQIGSFVEIKNSIIGNFCKINHMAFIGDANIEDNVIIGAGTITCNHDGKESQHTIIRSGAYIGSNVNLIAPIEIGNDALIGAGSTISKEAPENKITIERSEQMSFEKSKK
tara:strand:+ start:399 stop:1013 length:615 start_codon:yes stop_codon:yes gene_type:complete